MTPQTKLIGSKSKDLFHHLNKEIDIYTTTGSPTDKKPGNPIAKRTKEITTQITEGEAAI